MTSRKRLLKKGSHVVARLVDSSDDDDLFADEPAVLPNPQTTRSDLEIDSDDGNEKRQKRPRIVSNGAPGEKLSYKEAKPASEKAPVGDDIGSTSTSSKIDFKHVEGKKKLMKHSLARIQSEEDDSFLNSDDLELRKLSQKGTKACKSSATHSPPPPPPPSTCCEAKASTAKEVPITEETLLENEAEIAGEADEEDELYLANLKNAQLESIIEADDKSALGSYLNSSIVTFVEFPDEVRKKKKGAASCQVLVLDLYDVCLAAASIGTERCLEFLISLELNAIKDLSNSDAVKMQLSKQITGISNNNSINNNSSSSNSSSLRHSNTEGEGRLEDHQTSAVHTDATAVFPQIMITAGSSTGDGPTIHQDHVVFHIGNYCDIMSSMHNRHFLLPSTGSSLSSLSSIGRQQQQLISPLYTMNQIQQQPLLLVAMRKGHIEVVRMLCERYPLHSFMLLNQPADTSSAIGSSDVIDTEGAPVVSSLFAFVSEHCYPAVLVALLSIDKAIMKLRSAAAASSSSAKSTSTSSLSLISTTNTRSKRGGSSSSYSGKGSFNNSNSSSSSSDVIIVSSTTGGTSYEELQSVKLIELLKKKNSDGSNLLLWAAEEGISEFVDALLQLVPELLDEVDKEGISPLHSACMMGHVEVVYVLLRHDVDIFVADRNGWTGLLYALLRENVPCVLELLKANPQGALRHIQVIGRFLSNHKKDSRRQKILGSLASIPEFFNMINRLVRQNLGVLNGDHMGFILAHPALLNLENKLIVGRRLCAALDECSTTPYDKFPLLREEYQMAVQVRLLREDPWRSLTLYLSGKNDENGGPLGRSRSAETTPAKLKVLLVLRKRMQLLYKGIIEVGIGPGVEREVIEGVTRSMVDPASEYSIFRAVGDDQLTYVPVSLKYQYHHHHHHHHHHHPRRPPPQVLASSSLSSSGTAIFVPSTPPVASSPPPVSLPATVPEALITAEGDNNVGDDGNIYGSVNDDDDDDEDNLVDTPTPPPPRRRGEGQQHRGDEQERNGDDDNIYINPLCGSRRSSSTSGDILPLRRPSVLPQQQQHGADFLSTPIPTTPTTPPATPTSSTNISISRYGAFLAFGQLVGHFILRKFAAAPSVGSIIATEGRSEVGREGGRGRAPLSSTTTRSTLPLSPGASAVIPVASDRRQHQHGPRDDSNSNSNSNDDTSAEGVHGYSLLNINLPQCFWKLVLLKHPTLEDVSGLDATLYQNLLWVQENKGVEDLSLVFTAAETVVTSAAAGGGSAGEDDGKGEDGHGTNDAHTTPDTHHDTIVVPLVKGGESRDVTDKNKGEYIRLMIQHCTVGRFGKQADAVRKGILDVIPAGCLDIFTDRQLGLLLCGTPAIDITDWKRHTVYTGGYSAEKSDVIRWFWRLVDDIQDTERGLLLRFCTGCSRLPTGGFADLKPNFTISQVAFSPSRALPTAATCFNLFRLPKYPDEPTLRKSVMTAILHGSEGFSFS